MSMLRYTGSLAALLFLALGSACSGSVEGTEDSAPASLAATKSACVDLCAEADEEGCIGLPAQSPSCDAYCEYVSNLAEETECTAEFTEYYECIGNLPDLCDLDADFEECLDPVTEYAVCIATYCIDNPTHPVCEALASYEE